MTDKLLSDKELEIAGSLTAEEVKTIHFKAQEFAKDNSDVPEAYVLKTRELSAILSRRKVEQAILSSLASTPVEEMRLTDEEVKAIASECPTADEWREHHSQLHWERQRLIKAQLAKLTPYIAALKAESERLQNNLE